MPPVSTKSRHLVAVLALGERAEQPDFYAPLHEELTPPFTESIFNQKSDLTVIEDQSPVQLDCTEVPLSLNKNNFQNAATLLAPSAVDTSCSTEEIDNMASSLKTKCQELQASPMHIRLFMQRLQRVQTTGQLASFLCTQGSSIPLHHSRRARIRVQPTSVSRRADGVTRGAKRLPVGRPPNTDAGCCRPKRPRNLAYNISKCQPNAKSHGHK